jgi:hypothetical protein
MSKEQIVDCTAGATLIVLLFILSVTSMLLHSAPGERIDCPRTAASVSVQATPAAACAILATAGRRNVAPLLAFSAL